jgi:signal transduction histidine kinase
MPKSQTEQMSLAMRLTLPVILIVLVVLLGASLFVHQVLKRQYDHLMFEYIEHSVQFASGQLSLLKIDAKKLSPAEKKVYLEKNFSPKMAGFDFYNDVGLAILDRKSRAVLASYPVGAKLPTYKVIQQNTDPRNKALHRSKGDALLATIYMSGLDAYVMAFTPKTFKNDPFSINLRYMIFSLALPASIAALALLFSILRTNVTRPINALERTMSEIMRQGSYEKRVSATGSKELQLLAKQFNALLLYVSKRNEELKKYTVSLEDLVKERTKKLEQAHKQLVQQERLAAIGEFTAAVVHELRNPLTSIKLGVSRLKNAEELKSNDKERMLLVQEQTEKLEHMLSEILDFAAKRPTESKKINLSDILKKSEDFITTNCQEKNLRFQAKDMTKKCFVKADEGKLQQVWLNIVKNACDAAGESSEIVAKTSVKGDEVQLSVINTGETVSKSTLKRLFEPFFTTKSSGTGLGLAICKKLMVEMGGDIIITSNAGKTTVTLTMEKAG